MTGDIMPKFFVLVFLGLSVVNTACENRKAEAASASTSAAVVASAATTSEALGATDSTSKVARVVFVGKEHACDCTRKTVEKGLAVLQKVLGNPAKIPIEILQIDTQGDQVQPYNRMKPMVALPGIYFIDGKGGLVDMLQGEVTEAQVSKALGM